jgi:hypothetical protein
MIQIAILLLLFLLYAYHREGLRNSEPKKVGNTEYGVNPKEIYTILITKDHALNLYDEKYTGYVKSDVLLDMQYFNNATELLFQLSQQST